MCIKNNSVDLNTRFAIIRPMNDTCSAITPSNKICGNKATKFVILSKDGKGYKIGLSCEYHYSRAYNEPMEKRKKNK